LGWVAESMEKRGVPKFYSDEGIQVMLTLKVVLKRPFRALEGFDRSLMRLIGLDFRIPDH
jgi:Transposase DDE domain